MQHGLQFRRLVACLLVMPTYLAACTSWQVQEASPEQVLAEEQPNKVRVTLTDESQVEVFQPVVSGDTLMGLGKGGDEVSVPLSDVEHVAVRKTDAVATVVLIGVGIPTLIAAGFLIFAIGYGSSVS